MLRFVVMLSPKSAEMFQKRRAMTSKRGNAELLRRKNAKPFPGKN